MPELPEVEAVRRSLRDCVVGRRVAQVAVLRPDVVRGSARPADLLEGVAVADIQRLGKELCLLADNGRCVCVHLGMSGSLLATGSPIAGQHVHVIWTLEGGRVLSFRDPRRFGGVWSFASVALRDELRWRRRGEDALSITASRLHAQWRGRRAPIKTLLLNQALLSGVGNIYADEILFAAGLHPLTEAGRLDLGLTKTLVACLRRILRAAIAAGGSTLRDGTYRDGLGETGRYQTRHAVYARAGLPCVRCQTQLRQIRLAGRSTVYCPTCQPRLGFLRG